MNIIITKTFLKDFNKLIKQEKSLELFIEKIKKYKLINLENNYKKYNINLFWIAIRWIILIKIEKYQIPILIFKKSNKKYWMNLYLDTKIEKLLENQYLKIKEDIENNNFKIY